MERRDALSELFLSELATNPDFEPNFYNALAEVAQDVLTIEKNDKAYAAARVLARLAVPDRILSFRVTWADDAGEVQVNQAWRVQTSNAIGPYKGGLRFHPSVTQDTLKFLGFEQCFKNALTGLPMGGAKGGADFNPRGRSRQEIMRFCQALMAQMAPFIGPDQDVPAGDINVGTREVGWLFGAWRQRRGMFGGAFTGKGLSFGGSKMRVEATGFGVVYFVACMLAEMGTSLEGKRVLVSGKGNVATHAAQKAVEEGAKVLTLSDTGGTLLAEEGLTLDAIAWVQARKDAGEDIAAPPAELGLRYLEGQTPWHIPADIALPCATQNELDQSAAEILRDNGLMLLAEGANMPLTPGASRVMRLAGIAVAPGKAANAGGVAVSGLEMTQNAQRLTWSAARVDETLRDIMERIHRAVVAEGRVDGRIDYGRGANIAAYRKLADAITAQGVL
ncbi:NADP(+) dependent glutamate dehydrogenase (plasmid) [Dinoroseobacter shibae DFL 12 = DSM 16493]|jgi:glutamate dehydrogenase (NADP+)|uniref:Glutamate dehydrogenase n=1 Tax=Dinoroseobacter shibae (strain DSM 16493 / NCIMB 14021 / DFL 12) TaxID=398580 RepID=A8LTK4_DINSH|nr:NADP-specific glutamate dehydrogenase [Dinoroseobacter shibae]ABV95571.1 NADP(+) dependent glutamate dehydrogenase [Dinoroseobacter shibae DFL 12 = DSM 16493]URF48911.1 NADP-specific glutamate dehydrogenase [Dinoroseobacter shibae]URF53223.1 NADP-specific glutamate dehydrogenase [Dinoroseobacter shibae]